MARLVSRLGDERGVVYAEFLIAFFPLFFLFLGICQFTLMTSARVIVGQAANQAARSAAVVLEDSPKYYDGAARGELSAMSPDPEESIEYLIAKLGHGEETEPPSSPEGAQHGARMTPVRTTAYAPLISLAPHAQAWLEEASVAGGVSSGFLRDIDFSLDYVRAATAISIHDEVKAMDLAQEPIEPGATITVRVTYMFNCAIPFARKLMCNSLAEILPAEAREEGTDLLAQSESPGALAEMAPEGTYFLALGAEATLPTQDAAYTGRTE